jgi:peptidyl-dipeptidase A
MLSLGSSKHWTHALKLLTGEDSIKADAILEYFKPLHDWLIAENAKHPNEHVGWEDISMSVASSNSVKYICFLLLFHLIFCFLND